MPRDDVAVILIGPSNALASIDDWPGAELRRLGRIRVRIREDFEGTEARVVPVRIPAGEFPDIMADLETGGITPLPDRGFSVAETRGTRVLIQREFLRGDVDANGALNLTDAAVILNSLFLGTGELPCEDAADIDDNELINLTDPIALLRGLFLGDDPPPSPYPECGRDTGMPLGCSQFSCQG